jgi:hypothetical protein
LAQLAFHRSESKESSAFPKPYPLRNRAIGDEMTLTKKNIMKAVEWSENDED